MITVTFPKNIDRLYGENINYNVHHFGPDSRKLSETPGHHFASCPQQQLRTVTALYVRSLVVQDLRSVLGRSVYPKIFRGIDVCEFQHVMLGGIPFF